MHTRCLVILTKESLNKLEEEIQELQDKSNFQTLATQQKESQVESNRVNKTNIQGGNYNERIQGNFINIDVEGNYIQQAENPTSNLDCTRKRFNNLPRNVSGNFVGRETKLKELYKRLNKNERVAITAIAGMGGIGKTELALQLEFRLALNK